MARVAGRRGGGSRRRWPWTVAAVALASASAAAARAQARRRTEAAGEAGEIERVGNQPDALAPARHKAAAAAKQVGRRGIAAAKDTPQVVGKMVTRLKGKAARRRPGRPGEDTDATEAETSQEPDAAPGATPAPTTDSPRSGEPDSA